MKGKANIGLIMLLLLAMLFVTTTTASAALPQNTYTLYAGQTIKSVQANYNLKDAVIYCYPNKKGNNEFKLSNNFPHASSGKVTYGWAAGNSNDYQNWETVNFKGSITKNFNSGSPDIHYRIIIECPKYLQEVNAKASVTHKWF